MATFSGLTSSIRFQSFLQLYLPVAVLFVITSAVIFRLLGRVEIFQKLEGRQELAVRLLIATGVGFFASIVVRSAAFSLIGV